MAITLEGFNKLVQTSSANLASGEDSTVRLSENGGVKFGKWVCLGTRSKGFKEDNRTIRQNLLDALCAKFNGLESIPDSIKAVMKLDDFKIKNGRVTSCRPLTQRRITSIMAAVNTTFDLQLDAQSIHNSAVTGELKNKIKDVKDYLEEAVSAYNGLSNQRFNVKNLFEFNHSQNGEKEVQESNETLAKNYVGAANINFNKTLNDMFLAHTKVEFARQMYHLANNNGKDQFRKDTDRSLIMNTNGKLLPTSPDDKVSEQIEIDKIFDQEQDPKVPENKRKIKSLIVKSLLHQQTELICLFGLTAPFEGKTNNNNLILAEPKETTSQVNLYPYKFNEDGSIDLSISRFKDANSIDFFYLTKDDETPSINDADIKTIIRVDIHISNEEIDRIVEHFDEFKNLDIDKLSQEYKTKIKSNQNGKPMYNMIDEADKIVPENLRLNCNVSINAKIVVND